jgi:hypothetical protein
MLVLPPSSRSGSKTALQPTHLPSLGTLENPGSAQIRLIICYSKVLKSHKEKVRPQSLSVRQDYPSKLALRSGDRPQKPRNPAIFDSRLFTAPNPHGPENPLRNPAFSVAVHLTHSVPRSTFLFVSVGYKISGQGSVRTLARLGENKARTLCGTARWC